MEGRGTEPYGRFDLAFARSPQLFGCERRPLLALAGLTAFLVLVVFGFGIPGVVGGAGIFACGYAVLRRAAAADPQYFEARWAAMACPRRLPDVPRDPWLPRHVPFTGFDDPPPREAVARAWAAVAAAAAAVAAAVWLAVGAMAGIAALVALAGAVALWVAALPASPERDRRRRGMVLRGEGHGLPHAAPASPSSGRGGKSRISVAPTGKSSRSRW